MAWAVLSFGASHCALAAAGSLAACSAHMSGMANLHADLRNLIKDHLPSKNQEAQDILMELTMLLTRETPTYQYRHHLGWDTTWLDLDESQVAHVLSKGHTIQRRLVAGDWESVTEVPRVSD